MYKVAYMGFSPTMIDCLSSDPRFKLQFAVCEENRQSAEYILACEEAECTAYIANNDRELYDVIQSAQKDIDFFITYKTSVIIHDELLKQYDFYNFHGGDLRTNKGAHAIVWSILLDEKESALSMHKIDNKIDQGVLIDHYKVKIAPDDFPQDLRCSMEKGIPVLLGSLCDFLSGKCCGSVVMGGGYRRKIREEDYTIDQLQDSSRQIICKIKSQSQYKGAIYVQGEKKYFIKDWSFSERDVKQSEGEVFYLKKQGLYLYTSINSLNK